MMIFNLTVNTVDARFYSGGDLLVSRNNSLPDEALRATVFIAAFSIKPNPSQGMCRKAAGRKTKTAE